MCTKAEVAEVVSDKIKPIIGSIARIEKRLDEMPCQGIMEKTIRLEIMQENSDKLHTTDRKDIDILYRESRIAESKIATLEEQNKGQDKMSARAWVFIMMGINSIFLIAMYFITRG